MTGTRGHTNRDGRNIPTGYDRHKQQYYAYNTSVESNCTDELLLAQGSSFTQLYISNPPMHYHHYGLGYSISTIPTTTTTTPTSTPNASIYTASLSTRFVKASQNLAATDPTLQQQDGVDYSDSSGVNTTTTNSDTNITINNNEANTNNHLQQDDTLKAEDNTSTANDSVQRLGDTNTTTTASTPLLPTNPLINKTTNTETCIGRLDGGDALAAAEDEQQRYENQHGMDNYDNSYDYVDYIASYDHHHQYGDGTQQQEDDAVDEDVLDFGLCDSDDDEYIQAYMAYQQQQQQQPYFSYQQPYQQQQQPYFSYQQPKAEYRWYEDSPSGQLRRVDRRIQLFISDLSRETYQLPGMSTYCRRQIQGLATMYKLKISPKDLGNNKIGPLLRKGPKTHLPADRRAIEKYISKIRTAEKAKHQMERRPGGAASETLKRMRKEERQRLRGLPVSDLAPPPPLSSTATATKSATKKAIPRVVGSQAAPLASNNIGHRMMANMGWKEGDSLGANNDGIADPIQPVIRTNRRGLGA